MAMMSAGIESWIVTTTQTRRTANGYRQNRSPCRLHDSAGTLGRSGSLARTRTARGPRCRSLGKSGSCPYLHGIAALVDLVISIDEEDVLVDVDPDSYAPLWKVVDGIYDAIAVVRRVDDVSVL